MLYIYIENDVVKVSTSVNNFAYNKTMFLASLDTSNGARVDELIDALAKFKNI